MTKKVYVHVGAHKTGTTTLQFVLANNRDALRSNGLVYPDFENTNSHFQWANFIAGDVPQVTAEKHTSSTSEWLKNLKSNEALLLSAESFYRHINDSSDYLIKLQAALKGAEITPVLCLRNQGDYAKSLYSEWVLNWQYPHNIYRFIQDFYGWFDYEGFVAKISQLGKPVLLSYHQIAGSNLSSNFLAQLGYSAELVVDKSHLRKSPSDSEVYLKRLINKLYPHIKYRGVINDTVKKIISVTYPELKEPMPVLIWSGAFDAANFERSYRIPNFKLCQKYGKDADTFFPHQAYMPVNNVTAETTLKLNEAYRLILRELSSI